MVINKSKDAFRTIAEVADELDIATHVLRFWETKFPQIQPMKRSGGRRYYRPDDVELVRKIKYYLYDKRYTIEGVKKVIKEKGIKKLIGEEIQKDFFAESLEQIDLSEKNKDLLIEISNELKSLSDSLSYSLDEINN
jgi:DNA-binding transcriptional MerR regulator